ncbi:hypothetical protein E2P81_ATG07687 [Venturia nashicola]|uniref:Uncharacterized protein n=1 Tax=Venturia nashicola TaxID=86259 RepID=A0A4Z1NLA6_9PEZI|nr:hypothetical protein E6O75_ATG07851 [Venturia nashicola]TLD22494.1 hypothetical protein E2P81_ATG07687 [Venturia nashicola]
MPCPSTLLHTQRQVHSPSSKSADHTIFSWKNSALAKWAADCSGRPLSVAGASSHFPLNSNLFIDDDGSVRRASIFPECLSGSPGSCRKHPRDTDFCYAMLEIAQRSTINSAFIGRPRSYAEADDLQMPLIMFC